MPSAEDIFIRPEPTPNPASIRFVADATILPRGTANFDSPEAAAERSPLAEKLFSFKGVTNVFLGMNFVTITAPDVVAWDELGTSVMTAMREHIASGAPALTGETNDAQQAATPLEQGIIDILENEIRPAVAMDGGDVTFQGFTDGVVYLALRGACSGCPSSIYTLKMGIQRRLQEEFPEIQDVQAANA